QILVNPDYENGRRVLEALDEAGFSIRTAFWAYFGDAQEYRLVFVTAQVDRQEPTKAYRAVQDALSCKNIPIPFRQIVLLSPHHALARLAQAAVDVGRGAAFGPGPYLVSGGSENVSVDSRYVYRST